MSATLAADPLARGGGLARAIPHHEGCPEERAMSAGAHRALADQRPLTEKEPRP